MTDNRDSPTTSDPRSSLHQFSNRQDSAFQYGDPAKHSATVNQTFFLIVFRTNLSSLFFKTSAKDADETTKDSSVNIFQDDPYDEEEVKEEENTSIDRSIRMFCFV